MYVTVYFIGSKEMFLIIAQKLAVLQLLFLIDSGTIQALGWGPLLSMTYLSLRNCS